MPANGQWEWKLKLNVSKNVQVVKSMIASIGSTAPADIFVESAGAALDVTLEAKDVPLTDVQAELSSVSGVMALRTYPLPGGHYLIGYPHSANADYISGTGLYQVTVQVYMISMS